VELGALGDALLWLLAAVALLGAALCAAPRTAEAAGSQPAAAATAPAPAPRAATPEPAAAEPMPVIRGSVLLVEDTPLHQRLVSHMLWSSGLDVTLADSGPGALQLLENEHFDVVLMDVQLPGLDGLAVTARMRERGDHTPVIAISADGGEALRERAFQAGCNTHLQKPVDRTSLAATLAMYLSPPR
jgi:CheY-like chemotaxis protein